MYLCVVNEQLVFSLDTGLRFQLFFNNHARIDCFAGPDTVSADHIHISDVTEDTLSVSWAKPLRGEVNEYHIQFDCLGPNTATTIYREYNSSETSATAQNLGPGTYCNISVTPFIGDLEGNTTSRILENSTTEAGSTETMLKTCFYSIKKS